MTTSPPPTAQSLHDQVVAELQTHVEKTINRRPTFVQRKKQRTAEEQQLPAKFKVPRELQQRPLYVFAKFIAGGLGETDMTKFIDFDNLQLEKDNVTMLSVGPVLLAATGESDFYMGRVYELFPSATKPSWLKDIIKDPSHALYHPFVTLTKYYARVSMGMRTKGPDSSKALEALRGRAGLEQVQFTQVVSKYLKSKGHTPIEEDGQTRW